MDPEDKRRLEKTSLLAEENNRLIKKMLRQMRWGRLTRVAYWIVIIALSVGALYWFQPYWDQIRSAYGEANDTINNLSGLLR